jgi:hypothetical protein
MDVLADSEPVPRYRDQRDNKQVFFSLPGNKPSDDDRNTLTGQDV